MMERVAQARLWWRDNSLAVSFIIAASYSAFKIVLAILLSSWWLGALGAYYLIVASIRLYMLRSRQDGWIVYRRTGWLLVLLNLSVAIVITDVAWLGQGFHYPGYTIYAMASWTFYQLTVAIINLVRLKRSTDPVIRAVKDMRMCVVLVSLFTLQNAMTAAFGDGDAEFSHIMNCIVGFCVTLFILMISVHMVRLGRREGAGVEL